MTNPSTGTEFFGSSLSFNECEILAIQNIHRNILKKEASLYLRKWFDYRPMHPTAATYLAVHHYNLAYGWFVGTCKEHKLRFTAGLKGKDFMLSREKQSFWKLRQAADEIGARYDFFMREAMKWCVSKGWLQPPRPSHIATNDELLLDVANLWEIENRTKIQWATNERYMSSRFAGMPDQIAYEEHIATRIMQRSHPKFAIATALYQHDAIRIEEAIRRFPTAAIYDAIELAGKNK